jgi:hypothetical protein
LLKLSQQANRQSVERPQIQADSQGKDGLLEPVESSVCPNPNQQTPACNERQAVKRCHLEQNRHPVEQTDSRSVVSTPLKQ